MRRAPQLGQNPRSLQLNATKCSAWQLSQRLPAEIVAAIEARADHPDMGRIVPEFEQPLLRELIRPPFRIVYRRDPQRVRVVRVWRSERLLEVPD